MCIPTYIHLPIISSSYSFPYTSRERELLFKRISTCPWDPITVGFHLSTCCSILSISWSRMNCTTFATCYLYSNYRLVPPAYSSSQHMELMSHHNVCQEITKLPSHICFPPSVHTRADFLCGVPQIIPFLTTCLDYHPSSRVLVSGYCYNR